MRKTILTIFILFMLSSLSFSQDLYELRKAIDFYKTQKLFKDDWKDILTENDIKGSPYLNDEFINGTLFTTNKFQFIDIPIRYNIFNDQIEYKTENNQIQAIANPEILERIEFADKRIVYIPFLIANKTNKGFFIVLEEGKASLYAKPQVVFIKATLPVPFKDGQPAKFDRTTDQYYIKTGIEVAKSVGNIKELIEIFPENKDKIEAFIKTKKTKTNKPESLKELVRYYNSL